MKAKPRLPLYFINLYAMGRRTMTGSFHGKRIVFNPRTGIGQRLFFEGAFEAGEMEACRPFLSRESIVLDIGANIGLHTAWFAGVAPGGYVYSFEPGKTAFGFLLRNVKNLPNVLPVNIGIGNVNAAMDFHEASDDAYSGFRDTGRDTIKNTHPVQVMKMDDLFPRFERSRLDLVKIDVEGYEMEVIEGMRATISEFRPVIICEIHGQNNANPDPRKTMDAILGMGYKIFTIIPSGLSPADTHPGGNVNYLFRP